MDIKTKIRKFDKLLTGFTWYSMKNCGYINDTLYYINEEGDCYLVLTPYGTLKWNPDMYDKNYGLYGMSLGDFRSFIRDLVYRNFEGRNVIECRKSRELHNIDNQFLFD
jgi:hypothetical protein